MNAALERLLRLQRSIVARNEPNWPIEFCKKLLFCPLPDGLHIEFFGLPWDESFEEFSEMLGSSDVAPHVASLVFRGPDEGANGTRNWNLSVLLDSDVVFPQLRSVFFEPTEASHHNQTIIGSGFEEEGQVGRLLAHAPVLESLTVPSAPDESFFRVGERPLVQLRVDAGFDAQDFIFDLSQSDCFPALATLDFGDYNQREMEDYPGACTSFEDFRSLFGSPAFSSVGKFVLRNSVLSWEQLLELHRMKNDCQFMVIQARNGNYVR